MGLKCPSKQSLPLIKGLSKPAWLWTWQKKLVLNPCYWFWVALLHFGLFWFILSSRILVEPKDLNICFSQLLKNLYHGTYFNKIKQLSFWFSSYINVSGVFLFFCLLWSNHTGIIIQFVLKSSLYDAFMILRDYQFYCLICLFV